ncbi:hypothetical protein FKX85_14750 [Echinicola soli]|uniref:DUF4136 domain-containing protein n=1 Tax=Echinicola soli TaxID=2591634 RepID=A0A514CK51_9BACT|nr:hypothetical protein [Echinicola soli]QDH80231.1 hypothetical protein FKX85_14750 [Echinicola soli]
MNKLICFLIITGLMVASVQSVLAQKKVGSRIYKYGILKDQFENKVLVSFEEADPKLKNKTVKYFEKKDLVSLSWDDLFIPGSGEYSEEEFLNALEKNKVKTLVVIKVVDSHEVGYNYTSTSAYNSISRFGNLEFNEGSRETYSKDVTYTTDVSLTMSVFTAKDDYMKPVGVLEGKAYNSWGEYGSFAHVARKVIRRMLRSLDKMEAL